MKNDNDLHICLGQALQDMKMEQGEEFDPSAINLAELQRRTGISRAKLRRLKSNNFKDMPHALTGQKSVKTFILTVALLHQTNMKQSFRTRILLCDIKRQFKSQFRLGYLLTEEH